MELGSRSSTAALPSKYQAEQSRCWDRPSSQPSPAPHSAPTSSVSRRGISMEPRDMASSESRRFSLCGSGAGSPGFQCCRGYHTSHPAELPEMHLLLSCRPLKQRASDPRPATSGGPAPCPGSTIRRACPRRAPPGGSGAAFFGKTDSFEVVVVSAVGDQEPSGTRHLPLSSPNSVPHRPAPGRGVVLTRRNHAPMGGTSGDEFCGRCLFGHLSFLGIIQSFFFNQLCSLFPACLCKSHW